MVLDEGHGDPAFLHDTSSVLVEPARGGVSGTRVVKEERADLGGAYASAIDCVGFHDPAVGPPLGEKGQVSLLERAEEKVG